MKSYLSLIPLSAKQHKRQNRMTIICIVIAVFLVTAVFSMTEMAARQELSRLVSKHGMGEIIKVFSSNSFKSLVPIAIVLFIFVLMAGVLMISGSMNSIAAQRTRMYGMMRCIGMSKRQIIRYVRLEALNYCKTAIPGGLVLGIACTWILCAVLKFGVAGEWADMPQMRISLVGLVSGTVVGLLTVLIAARKPAKRASKVSPVSALSNNTDEVKSIHAIKDGVSIEKALGKSHAMQPKKNLFLLIGSFALSIILFFSFSVIKEMVDCLLPQSVANSDIEICSNPDELIDGSVLKNVNMAKGVKRAFGRRVVFNVETVNDPLIQEVDIVSFEDFDLDALKIDGSLVKGSDINKVKESGAALVITDSDVKKGDYITVCGTKVEIAGQTICDIFSEDGNCNGKTSLIVSDETFKKLTGISDYTMILVQLDKNVTDEDIEEITFLAGNNIVKNHHEDNTRGTYIAFIICCYSFLIIIALVTILNIVNSISMNTSARIKQYGAMRAVGMSKKQVANMIKAEALTYAILGCFTGVVLGSVIHKVLFDKLVTAHFNYVHWTYPVVELVIIIVFFAISVFFGVREPIKRINEMSITETIKNE